MYFGSTPYGLEGYVEHGGDGNMFREETFGQPNTLQPGDVLANGFVVARKPHEEGNGGVGLSFTNGSERVVAARIPLLLEAGSHGKEPSELAVGDILETGCVVLSPPQELSKSDPNYARDRREIAVNITSGYGGALIGMPRDLIIALYGETYPPSQDNPIGALAIANTLRMGARARKLLPNYGRLTDEPEHERVAGVFSEIANLRAQAMSERAAFQETVAAMQGQCDALKGVELRITGQLQGRRNYVIDSDDPQSQVKDLHIEVTSARVTTYPGSVGTATAELPYIEFQAHTVEGGEHVSARLNTGKFGVSAEVVENSPA